MVGHSPLAVVKRAREQHRPEGRAVLAILNELKGLVATRTGEAEEERVENEAQKINDSWLVVPANRGQVLARLDVTVRGPGTFVDAGGVGAAKAKLETIDEQLAGLDADLKRFEADPAWMKDKRFWIDTGTNEGDASQKQSYVDSVRRLEALLKRAGLVTKQRIGRPDKRLLQNGFAAEVLQGRIQ